MICAFCISISIYINQYIYIAISIWFTLFDLKHAWNRKHHPTCQFCLMFLIDTAELSDTRQDTIQNTLQDILQDTGYRWWIQMVDTDGGYRRWIQAAHAGVKFRGHCCKSSRAVRFYCSRISLVRINSDVWLANFMFANLINHLFTA